jgi:predicted Zn-dependent peptidase
MTIPSSFVIERTILDNGLTVISEFVPAVRSVSLGVWIKAGSRFETADNNGIAHFLEHMLFKGTKKRTAFKIAQSLEELGGHLNAYTSKEVTCYFSHTLDSHLSISVNVLSDLINNPLFKEKDIEKERLVIQEEINAVMDTPEEYIFDIFQEHLFPNQSIGNPILGTPKTIADIDRDKIIEFWNGYYQPKNIIISAAGNIDHKRLIRLIERNFHFEGNAQLSKWITPKKARQFDLKIEQPLNQTHICMGLEGVSYHSKDRFDLIALNTYLGGGMSARLFQVIRERFGLAYSVYSNVDFYKDTGVINFYMGTDQKNQNKAITMLLKEIRNLNQNGLNSSIVRKLKEQLKGNLILGLESTSRRMTRLAKNEIYYGGQVSVDEMIASIEKISTNSLQKVANKLLNPDNFNIIKLSPIKN